MKRTLLAVVAVTLLTAVEPHGSTEQSYAAGETLDYDLTWLRMSGGYARMTIAPLAGDVSKLRITSVAQTSSAFSRFFHVRDEIESVVDRSRFSTLHYRKLLHEGKRSRDETTVIDPATQRAVRRGDEYLSVPTPVFDPLSLIYHLRQLDLSVGKTLRFPVLADGKLYHVEATVLRREPISTPAGTFQTVVVKPQMETGGVFRDEKGRMTMWFSDDARHLPVRITTDVKIGTITATLRSVIMGASNIDPTVPEESK